MVKHMGNDRFVFDLHCDTLTAARELHLDLQNQALHVSLHRLPEHHRLCQCMAVFMPDTLRGEKAIGYFEQVLRYYREQLELWSGLVGALEDVSEVDALLAEKRFALLLTVEGGSVLAGNPERVGWLWDCGVRMLTLTWNDANELCGGVATPEKGFTATGREVVARMEQKGMVVDVSHLSDTGFWELCEFTQRPFVASHSNARAVCGHPRNLTDEMILEVIRRGGLIGLNFYREFITLGGKTRSFNDLLRHVHHILKLGGQNVLALGGDFDGADVPGYLRGIGIYPDLYAALERSGISAEVIERIFYKNARNFFTERYQRGGVQK